MDFIQSSFAHLFKAALLLCVEEREGRLYFPASLPQTLAAESPLRQRGWARSSKVSSSISLLTSSRQHRKGFHQPLTSLLVLPYSCVHCNFCACSTSFYCHHLPLWQHNPQICYFGYSSIPLGTSVPSMTMLLQSRDPKGRRCVNRHCWEQAVCPTIWQYTCLLIPTLACGRRQSSRFLYTGKSYIAGFVLFTLFCSPACLE